MRVRGDDLCCMHAHMQKGRLLICFVVVCALVALQFASNSALLWLWCGTLVRGLACLRGEGEHVAGGGGPRAGGCHGA